MGDRAGARARATTAAALDWHRGFSPFGHSGRAARGEFGSAAQAETGARCEVAEARQFRDYRDDLVLDVRQMEVALRKLRAFAREGADGARPRRTIDADRQERRRARGGAPGRRVAPNTRVILMMDVGGSMDPYAHLVSRLSSAASKATHFKELRTYYFHNCIYGRVYKDARLQQPVQLSQLFAECGTRLQADPGRRRADGAVRADRADNGRPVRPRGTEGLVWLMRLAEHFPQLAWLNPEPPNAVAAEHHRGDPPGVPDVPAHPRGAGRGGVPPDARNHGR